MLTGTLLMKRPGAGTNEVRISLAIFEIQQLFFKISLKNRLSKGSKPFSLFFASTYYDATVEEVLGFPSTVKGKEWPGGR